VVAGVSVLEPQEAKEIAAKATNMKTNFFILFVELKVKQSIACIKTMQRYGLFSPLQEFAVKKVGLSPHFNI